MLSIGNMLWTCSFLRQFLIFVFFTVITGMQPAMGEGVNFTIQPTSRVLVRSNRTFLVPCTAKGGLQTIKYWRNESVLNSRVAINATNEGLWFVNGVQYSGSPQVHRVGIFRCMVKTTAGVVMSKKFELSFIYLENISIHLSSPAALFGNVLRLKCSVDTNQPVNYTWYKDSVILSTSKDNRVKFLLNGVLQIRNYKARDDGSYYCRAENEYKFITSAELKVVGESASKTNVHIYPGQIIHTKVGDPLVIECIQYSPQKSHVTWSKVTKLGTRTLVNGTGFGTLVFESVQASDAGDYRCLATDGVGKTVHVSVGAPPSFTKPLPATATQKEGGNVVLKCRVKGNPAPTVKWYKNGRELVENSQTSFHRNHTEHRLVLKNVPVYFKGIYQCEIENKYGSSIGQTLLKVIERMDPPCKVEVYPLSAMSVNVTWKIPLGYKSVIFQIFCFDYLRKEENFQKITERNSRHSVLTFLRPYTNYAIYVKMYAEGKPRGMSEPVWVRTLATEPSGPPNEVKLRSYSYGTVDVTWIPPMVGDRNGEIISYEVKYRIEDSKIEFNQTADRNLYTATLRNLIPGKKYLVKVAVRTKTGLGPFSQLTSCVVSKTFVEDVIPAPKVVWKSVNKSILISVTPPVNVDVKEYRMTYRLLGDYMGVENRIVRKGKRFDYKLETVEKLEYVIEVTAFGAGMRDGRPAIVVVTSQEIPSKVNHSMFETNYTDQLPQIRISCEPTANSKDIAVRWEHVPMNPEFEVKYFILGEPTGAKTIVTKYSNVTISDVLPGATYEVEIKMIFHHPVLFHTSWMPESKHCQVPEKAPDMPPSGITCSISGSSIVVKWRAPMKPNGKILQYHIWWHDERKGAKMEVYPILFEPDDQQFEYSIKDFERHLNFSVFVNAENSAGQGPMGYCSVDTSKIEGSTKPKDETDESSSDNTDIEKGIIIGCIISVLLLFVLIMFVCWSGCRKRKASQKRAGDMSGTPYYNSRLTNQHLDTVSTEVSELSSKQHTILKKFIDEETSKESDRGLGMTPKSSRLYLDSEKIPFLPRAANQGGRSADTSCDSQDSGVQGYGKKSPPTPGAPKDPDKTPLQAEDSVAETVF